MTFATETVVEQEGAMGLPYSFYKAVGSEQSNGSKEHKMKIRTLK